MPGALCAFGLIAALAAVLQFSLRAYVPGSLEPGGFTLANFTALAEAALRAGLPRHALDLRIDGIVHAGARLSRRLRAGADKEPGPQIGHSDHRGDAAVPRRGGAHLFLDRRARQ